MKDNKKMIQKIGLGALVMGAMLLIGSTAFAADTSVWTTLSVSGTVTENVTLNVEEELRFSNITDPSLANQRTDLNLGIKVNELVGVSAGYLNTSAGEHRPYVGIGLVLWRGNISLDSSTKIELRDFDTVRGRTDLTASTDMSGVTPWITEELFVDSSGITGNRASVGVTRGINNTFSVNAFYMLDTAGTDFANSGHVVGLGLGVSL
jgi:hypothetical protein